MTRDGAVVWDAEFRPRMLPRLAWAVAVPLGLAGILVGVSNDRSQGAFIRTVDQIAYAGVAVVLAAAVVVLATRPRLRVGPSGLAVRNILDDRLIPWSDVVGVSFPAGKRWPRVELPAYEYVPVLAIQSFDRDRAVGAMDTVRELMARYRPEPAAPSRY